MRPLPKPWPAEGEDRNTLMAPASGYLTCPVAEPNKNQSRGAGWCHPWRASLAGSRMDLEGHVEKRKHRRSPSFQK